jgi:hypothetical protein
MKVSCFTLFFQESSKVYPNEMMSPDRQVNDEADTSRCLFCNKSVTLKPTGKPEYENHLSE